MLATAVSSHSKSGRVSDYFGLCVADRRPNAPPHGFWWIGGRDPSGGLAIFCDFGISVAGAHGSAKRCALDHLLKPLVRQLAKKKIFSAMSRPWMIIDG